MVFLISALSVTVTACGRGAGGGPGGNGDWPAGRRFQSTAVTEAGKDRPLVAGTRIHLSFLDDGRVSAQAGCNTIGGSGRIDGGRLVLGEGVSMTEMGCDEPRHSQDTWLADFLGAKPTWALSGSDLLLRSGDVEIRLLDTRVADADRPLIGTRWLVDTIITGDAASSIPSGVEAYLIFDNGGASFSGSTGCASVGGTTQLRGDTILFPAVLPSPRPCAGDQAVMDNAVTSALFGEVTYQIDGPRLTLTGPSGDGLGLRATS